MENHKYYRLYLAIDAFRQLFIKKLLNPVVVEHSKLFFKDVSNKPLDQWTYNDAFRVYNLIKPYAKNLSKIGFDFSSVPIVSLEVQAKKEDRVISVRNIGFDGKDYIVSFPYNHEIYKAIVTVPGRQYIDKTKQWKIPLSSTNELKHIAFGYNFEIGDKALMYMNNVNENLEQSYSSEYIELGLPLKKELYGYQTVGVKYLADNRYSICADQMRLGKTPQSIGATVMLNSFPCICIVPKTLRIQWKAEWEGWTNKKVIILDKKNFKKLPYLIENKLVDIVITNYDGVQTYFVEEIKTIEITTGENAGTKYHKVYTNGLEKLFNTAILDEAHNCRNKKTLRYKCVKKVFEEKKAKFLLTGTPIVKGAEDLAALFELIGRIDEFGGYHKFIKTFKGMDKKFLNNNQNSKDKNTKAIQELKELNVKMRSLCFIRRERWQVPNTTPEKYRSIIKVEIDNRADYDHAEFSLQSFLANNGASMEKISKSMNAELLVKYNLLKQISAKGKISALLEHVEQIVGIEGEKMIICCWFNETVQTLKNNLKKYNPVTICGRIDGHDMKDAEIEQNKYKFNNDPNCNIIIITYGKGSEGHNLGAANHCTIVELGWTYKDQGQIEDRAVVVGKKSDLLVTYLLGLDTLDEHIYNIINSRKLIEKESTGGGEEVETTFSALTKKFLENIKPVGI